MSDPRKPQTSTVRAVSTAGGEAGWSAPRNETGIGFGSPAVAICHSRSAVPPPAGIESPMAWGSETTVTHLVSAGAADIRCERRDFAFRYRSADHWIEVFRNFYGPTHRAFAALDVDGQAVLRDELASLLGRYDRGGGTSLVVPGEYLEAVVTNA